MLSHPSLLAHTIYQALSFDAALAEEGFTIADTSARDAFEPSKWPGVADIILGKKEWFEAWIDGEKKCMCIYLLSRTEPSNHVSRRRSVS